jgi:hypothetical protein
VAEAVRVREPFVLLERDGRVEPPQLAAEQVLIGLKDRGERAHFFLFWLGVATTFPSPSQW